MHKAFDQSEIGSNRYYKVSFIKICCLIQIPRKGKLYLETTMSGHFWKTKVQNKSRGIRKNNNKIKHQLFSVSD